MHTAAEPEFVWSAMAASPDTPDQAEGSGWPEDGEIEWSAGAANDEDTEDFLSTTWDLLAVLAIGVLVAVAGIVTGLTQVAQHLAR